MDAHTNNMKADKKYIVINIIIKNLGREYLSYVYKFYIYIYIHIIYIYIYIYII